MQAIDRRTYAERHARIQHALERDFAEWIDVVPSVAGMHLAAELRSRKVSVEQDLHRRAADAEIGFDRLSRYCAGGRPLAGLVLGYGGIPTAKIDEGLRRLHRCFTE